MSDEKNDHPEAAPRIVPPPAFSSRNDDTTAVSEPDTDASTSDAYYDDARNDETPFDEGSRDPLPAYDSPLDDNSGERADESTQARTIEEPAVEDHTVVRDTGDLPEPVAYPTTSFAAEQDRLHGERETASAPQYAQTAQYEQSANYPQRTFSPPPVPPRKKGNRGVGALIAVLSVILFAVVYAVIAAVIIGVRTPQALGDTFMTFAVNPVFYVPAIIFVVAFVLVVLLANRASWWAYVLGSLLVGALVYFGTIGVALLSVNVLGLTPSEALVRFANYAADPFIIAAGLVAREVSLWTGAAISARGRRMKAKNDAAREEYDRAAAEHRAEYERATAS